MTTGLVRVWLTSEEDENIQFKNADEITEDVTNEDEDKGEGEGTMSVTVMRAEVNSVDTNDVLVLNRLQKQLFRKSLKIEKQKIISNFIQPSTLNKQHESRNIRKCV